MGSALVATVGCACVAVSAAATWPACPQKGCLPCPSNAIGRPDCRCVEGYTLDGDPPKGRSQLLTWDATKGWFQPCVPVQCGAMEPIQHGLPDADTQFLMQRRLPLRFGERARFTCASGFQAWPDVDTSATALRGRGEAVVEAVCSTDGIIRYVSGPFCAPRCGDGLLMPTDHMPQGLADQLENCDDGNSENRDGCNEACRVEAGFVCSGGGATRADNCHGMKVFLDSAMALSITGSRIPLMRELRRASHIALAQALGLPERDVEILQVQSSREEEEEDDRNESVVYIEIANFSDSVNNATWPSDLSPTRSASGGSKYHSEATSVEVAFRVKISDPQRFSHEVASGALNKPAALKAKLWIAFHQRTTLGDLHIDIVEIKRAKVSGDVTWGHNYFDLIALVTSISLIGGPIAAYLFFLSTFGAWIYWVCLVRTRQDNLANRVADVSLEFKQGWAFQIFSCFSGNLACLGLLCCLPARMADTWDAAGLVPFWAGLRQSVCCLLLYIFGFGSCAACAIAGPFRSQIRNLLGFGHKNNAVGIGDVMCYVCCPCCCVVQEARHIDAALAGLPPPLPPQLRKIVHQVQGVEARVSNDILAITNHGQQENNTS